MPLGWSVGGPVMGRDLPAPLISKHYQHVIRFMKEQNVKPECHFILIHRSHTNISPSFDECHATFKNYDKL